jgi:predicted amidohydrolase
MPRFRRTDSGGQVIESNGSPGCYGGSDLAFELDDHATLVVASVSVRFAELDRGLDSVEALVQWVDADGEVRSWAPLESSGRRGEWVVLRSRPIERVAGCQLNLRVLLKWSATGWVEWADAEVSEVAPIVHRRVRLGAGSSQRGAGEPATLVGNRDRYLELCHRAGQADVDLLCLPETILSEGMPYVADEGLIGQAVEIPGEYILPFADLARQYSMAISFSVLERAGELVYNTAVLIDDEGSIALTYRKVHLAIKEAWRGVTPGEEFPVVALESGMRVGMNICMDSSSSVSARAVAANGAEVLLLPINNDFRATQWSGDADESLPFSLARWTVIQQARALDNHLYIVAARNDGIGTGIFGPDGTVLAMDRGETPLITADIDLDDLRLHPLGSTYRDVISFQRHSASHRALVSSAVGS